jgi:hypothetical protein
VNTKNLPWIAAAVTLLVHLVGNAHYGFFRDELYFIICGRHPQWGYVDQPSVVPLLAALTQVFGHSLFLLRAVPALFAAGGAYVTCKLVVDYGGGVFAQVLASLAYLFAGVLLSFGAKVGTDEVNLLTWPLIALLVLRITKGADPRMWLVVGALAGITLESKYSVIFFLVALAIGLIATKERRVILAPWFAAGVGVMIAIALPNLLWQAHYGFPMIELLRNGANGKNTMPTPLEYLFQEILITNLFLFPVWLIGLYALLREKSFRFLGVTYVALIALMMISHGKHYYPAAIYPVLIAAGAAMIEYWTTSLRIVRGAIVAYALLLGPVFVPFSLPILSEPHFIAYQDKLGAILHISKSAVATEHGRETSELPGDWADMHGWEEMANQIESIYNNLPPNERVKAVVVAQNYGEASAVEFFTPDVPVVSGHNQYWQWGTRGYDGSVIIDFDGDCGAKDHLFRSSARVATFSVPYTIGWETDDPIMVCRGLKVPLQSLWPKLKNYI